MKTLLSAVCVLAVLAAGPYAQAPSGSDPWMRKSSKPQDFHVAKLPWNTFSIELPDDWQLVPSFGAVLLTAAEKARSNQPSAAIIVEHTLNIEPLNASDVDQRLATLEADWVRQRDPSGENFEHQAKEVDGRRYVMIQYTRPGFNGRDRIVVYVLASGKVMYRLYCIAPEKQIAEKYQAIFAHVAATFKPSAAAGS
jgi:hypothetical protein